MFVSALVFNLFSFVFLGTKRCGEGGEDAGEVREEIQ